MRTYATYLLIALLALCPVICGAAQAGFGLHCCNDGDGSTGGSPVPCPGDGVTCICAGAIQSDEVQVTGLGALDFPIPFDLSLGSSFLSLLHDPAHLADNNTPLGNTAHGDSSQVRALLQNFRC
ncbi:MAG: hypothetical protein IRY99_18095 [Isosphaeraceae bacterium]|nr:hypothetical protein [Isosphaeraceae bacterium]